MQVSWIDPEEVAALAESLRPSLTPKTPAPTPVAPPKPEPVEPLVTDPVVVKVEEAALAPNLAAFRQRLQSIREKAIHAGLLTPQPVAPPMEAAPVATIQPPLAEAPAAIEPAPLAVEAEVSAPSNPAPEPVFTPSPPPTHFSAAPVELPQVPISQGASVKDRLEAYSLWAGSRWNAGELLIVDEYGDLLWGPPKKSGLVLSTMMAWNAAIRASAQAASGASQVSRQILATGETLTILPCPTRLGLLQIALVKAQAPSEEETTSLCSVLAEVMDFPG